MFRNKKQNDASSSKFFSQDRLFVFGTVFFVAALALLLGVFLFPRVRTMLHDSALATGIIHDNVLSAEAPPITIFSDVDSGHPNAEAIAYLREKQVVNGYPEGTFKPDNSVTRAELLKLLFDAQRVYPSQAVYRACFKDVKDDWFAPYVCYAKAKGLVQGYADGTFVPGKDVTVTEALKIVLQAYQVGLLKAPPLEAMQLEENAWYVPYIWTAYDKKLVTWGNSVHPQQLPNLTADTVLKTTLTRAHLAEILYRMMK